METATLTFDDLIKLEPRLSQLFSEAKNYEAGDKYWPLTIWYREYKPLLTRLVGWFAEKDNEVLHSKAAYDLAYETVHHALPGCLATCRGCD